MTGTRQPAIGLLVVAVLTAGVTLGAQQAGVGGAQQPGAGGEPPPVAPAEIQRMFDAYALVQAQDQLKLGDEQYPRFLPRFKALQDTRRRFQVERTRTLQELRRLAVDRNIDESMLKDRLKALQDLEARGAADIRKAQEGVDQVLDVRQQAQFRLFEELMERRKIELVTRARQNNRLNNRGLRGQP